MHAFLLAAGEGRRLRPLTDSRPKPMIVMRGRPILEHNIRLLAAHGIRDIILNTYYLPATVMEHFGDGSRFGVRIVYSHEPSLLGTAGALNPARDILGERFLLMYGDNLSTCNLSRLIEKHGNGALATVALFERDDVFQSGVARLESDDRISAFIEKPQPGHELSRWVNAGALVLEASVFDFIPRSGPSDIGRDVLPAALAAGKRINGYRMTERLWWIDSLADYERTLADDTLQELS
jgi:NDP-sugar pyrophosphorylase family protein